MITGLWNMGPRLRGDDSMRTDESAVYRALGAHDHRGSPGGMQALDWFFLDSRWSSSRFGRL